jgi:hypothetical protein
MTTPGHLLRFGLSALAGSNSSSPTRFDFAMASNFTQVEIHRTKSLNVILDSETRDFSTKFESSQSFQGVGDQQRGWF